MFVLRRLWLQAVHLGIEYNELECAKVLLERGAEINARAGGAADGHTPLFHAVICFFGESAEATRFVLEHGGKPELKAALRLVHKTGDLPAGADLRSLRRNTRRSSPTSRR